MKQFQVAIIGAGPAGAAAAIYLKQKNVCIALIDKATFPRDKVCGDGIPLKTFRLLEDLGFSEEKLFKGGYKINQMRIFGPDRSETVFGGLTPDAGTKSGCIPRKYFDNLLFEKAASRADEVFTGFKFLKKEKFGQGHRLYLQNLVGDEIITIGAELVLVADGGNSRIARQSGLLIADDKFRFDGLRQYYGGKNFSPALQLFYDRRTLPGYVWIFPVAPDKANVGIMINRKFKKQSGKTIRQIFDDLRISNPDLKAALQGASPLDGIRGAPLPLGTMPGSRIAEGTILIGDAAAFINPVTGGGIYFAILSARKAAEVAASALAESNLSKENLKPYENWWRQEILPGFQYSEKLKAWLNSERFANWFFKRMGKNRLFANFFIMVYGQPLPKYTFLNPLFWAKIVLSR